MFKEIKTFIIDMDGTFYLSDVLIKGSDEFVGSLKEKGKDFFFFTNNSSHNAKECHDKLEKIGFPVPYGKIIISSHVTIDYIKSNRPNKTIYLLGNERLTNDFANAGIELVDDEPDIVVLGFDTTLNYEKISKAARFLSNNVEYIATHPDVNCPVKGGYIPDTGSMIALFKASTGREPDLIMGKPNKQTVNYITKKLSCKKQEIAFIGDRLETDIAIGSDNGIKSILVLSGVTTKKMSSESDIKPTLVVNNLKELCDYV